MVRLNQPWFVCRLTPVELNGENRRCESGFMGKSSTLLLSPSPSVENTVDSNLCKNLLLLSHVPVPLSLTTLFVINRTNLFVFWSLSKHSSLSFGVCPNTPFYLLVSVQTVADGLYVGNLVSCGSESWRVPGR